MTSGSEAGKVPDWKLLFLFVFGLVVYGAITSGFRYTIDAGNLGVIKCRRFLIFGL